MLSSIDWYILRRFVVLMEHALVCAGRAHADFLDHAGTGELCTSERGRPRYGRPRFHRHERSFTLCLADRPSDSINFTSAMPSWWVHSNSVSSVANRSDPSTNKSTRDRAAKFDPCICSVCPARRDLSAKRSSLLVRDVDANPLARTRASVKGYHAAWPN